MLPQGLDGRFRVILLLAGALASTARGARPGPQDGTRRMAERLRRIAQASDPRENQFMKGARAALIGASLESEAPASRMPVLRALAQELLDAGRTADAITRLDQLEAMMRERGADQGSRVRRDLRVRQAIAQLRRAEAATCVEHHGARCCIFPIEGSGIHVERSESQAAAAILKQVLERSPGDLQA